MISAAGCVMLSVTRIAGNYLVMLAIYGGGENPFMNVYFLSRAYLAMKNKAEHAAAEFDGPQSDEAAGIDDGLAPAKGSCRSFRGLLRHVLEKSDVLIEVLDARDPQSCRNLSIENEIVASNKKLILLLNKVDLVPK